MKKFISILLVALMAMGAEAQVTGNVRLGGGTIGSVDGRFGIAALALEANISFGANRRGVFSPSLLLGSQFKTKDSESNAFVIPLHLGYKFVIGDGAMFIPKIGPAAGICCDNFVLGPSVELAFEVKHFVIAGNGFYGFGDERGNGFLLTLGYKF